MTTIQLAVTEEVFASLRRSPDELAGELRVAAAMHWYSQGKISQERAAQLAGMDRTDFLLALAREGIDAFVVDLRSLRKELAETAVGNASPIIYLARANCFHLLRLAAPEVPVQSVVAAEISARGSP